MDPRQPPQQPFSRNSASPYGRTPFHPSSNQAPFPPASHPPPAAPSYAEHNRRPSDPPYYNTQRSYAPEGPPMSGPGHSRHQSASSVGHGTPVNRSMPPPSSPQQQASQQPSHLYGPPPPRPPPVSVGPPTSFPSRELPSLPPLGRPASNGGSSMSISSMLGGPPPAAREPPPSHYASPVTTSAPPPPPSSSLFGQSTRMTTTAPEYAPFRRPQTPEHQRPYEPRDSRASSAGSPPNMGHYSTPEARRFGTPQQGYAQRVPVVEERREPARVPNPNVVPPPRPSSQPSYNPPPPRISENPRPPIHGESIFGRRVETVPRAPEPISRAEPAYGRPAFEERHTAYGYAERERQEREAAMREREREESIRREREQRERAEHEHVLQREYAHQIAQRNSQGYSRAPEPREQPAWMRSGHEPPRPPPYERPPYEQPPERVPPQQVSNGYEYPVTSAPQYGGPPAYAPPEPRPVDHRYGPPPPPPAVTAPPPQHNIPLAAYEAAMERERAAEAQRRQQPMYGAPTQAYQPHESPQRRPVEEQIQQQRSLLSVQEINRRGRASPLPQAVQGAQHQINGPGGEPSIKNEFGRMFSGIGSGVGAMGMPSPVASGIQGVPFSNSSQPRRDDLESLQDSPVENGGHQLARTSSRGGRRRKLKEEDSKGDDESSNGRLTPSGRGKRAKNHHHRPHQLSHHHHRTEQAENTSSPSQSNLTPFKSVRGSTIPSPPGPEGKANPNLHHHHVPRPHVHHHVTPSKPVNTVIPLLKTTIHSQVVLDSVSNRPRNHLGHGYYRSTLSASSSTVKRDRMSDRGFASTPHPLPRFEGKENCTFTVKIPAVYLGHKSREEITSRKALWGTDIYTDDSDVIAACIHQGWFRGAWAPDVDVSLLDLDIEVEGNGAVQPPVDDDALITSPPATGPMHVPERRDCHVTVLILPLLQKYSSLTRFGIRSREFGAKHDGYQSIHDGLSFMIMSIRWVKGVDGEDRENGKERLSIFGSQLNDQELEDEEALGEFFYRGNGPFRKSDTSSWFKESYERGSDRSVRMGMGTANWWKGTNGKDKSKDKEEEVVQKTIEPPVPTPAPAPVSAPVPVQAIPTPPTPQLSTPARPTIPLSFSPPTPEPLSPIAPKNVEPETPPVVEPSPLPPVPEATETEETIRERQIERVTERMIKNANTASPAVLPTTPVVDGATEVKAEGIPPANGDVTTMSG
ncbi:Rxt3-domain-containing protein [Mollisia scopiformis]|uniref:Rxt3-domain-containing protein n=1 Tax=Mollisia scopiformis TaxID=149040 RepID=A0A194X0L8_MOLSC|nr:Rxt3-domain-containing protein [Mollisia scopiformis]KUJ13499.1 Rxt3-domain-containing protein [Mollisia scopiformis]